MLIGTVVKKDDGLHVVTRVVNDRIIMNTEPLRDYISKSVMVNYNGEYRTLREIIDMESDNYLAGREINEF